MHARPDRDVSPACAGTRAHASARGTFDTHRFDHRCVRYTEYMIALHGALIFGTPSLGAALDQLARDAPLVCGKASWGYDADSRRGWFQLAADASEQDYLIGTAAFDLDMRQRGLVPVATRFLR